MRTLLDRKNFSSIANGQVAAHRVTGRIIKRLWWESRGGGDARRCGSAGEGCGGREGAARSELEAMAMERCYDAILKNVMEQCYDAMLKNIATP